MKPLFHRPKRKAAGALIFGPDGRLLMVHDRMRREWNYPAGYVEPDESPLEACRREVAEEVNIHLDSSRLQYLDAHSLDRPLGRLEFTTFTANVTAAEIANVRLQALELTKYRWVTPDEALDLTSPRHKPRLRQLLGSSI